jgi:hypothetical protein
MMNQYELYGNEHNFTLADVLVWQKKERGIWCFLFKKVYVVIKHGCNDFASHEALFIRFQIFFINYNINLRSYEL